MIKTSGTPGFEGVSGPEEDGGDPRRLAVSGVGGVRISGTGVCLTASELVFGADIWGGVRFKDRFFFGFGSVMLGTAGIDGEDG